MKKNSSEQVSSEKRGAALARAIENRYRELGLTQREAGVKLGFTEAHFSLLLNGGRWLGSVEESKLRQIAGFLDVPYLSVVMLAEILTPEDFYRETTVESQLTSVFAALEADKRFVMIVPSRDDWENTPLSVRLLAAACYQQVSAKDFLEKAQMLHVWRPAPEPASSKAAAKRAKATKPVKKSTAQQRPATAPVRKRKTGGAR